jgi:methionine synthase II (cobalamin-independent)
MTDIVASRKTHLVGAWPGISGAHAMETAMRRLGPHLLRLTDGETGERAWWVLPTMAWLRANPDVEVIKEGDYSSYAKGVDYRVIPGHHFDPDNIQLQYHRNFQRSYPGFKVLRERENLPQLSFQVGLPAPVDLAVDGFGYEAAQDDHSLAQAFAAATLREIAAIHAEAQDDVIFQLETVVGMVAVARATPQAQPEVAKQMAQAITSMVERAPAGARFGAHLCLGDFHHRALAEMGSARPLVTMANALLAAWPEGQPLEYIHAPFAAAEKPGSFDPSWYEPLAELDLPEDLRFVAGFIHEDLDVEQLREIQALIERAAGRRVDIAATCGLGRRPSPDQAWDAMKKTVQLLETAPQPV